MTEKFSVERHTKAIASGDTEAFALFYQTWFDRMYKETRKLTRRDEAFCMDVVQDAMIKVIKSLRQPVKSEKQFWAWLRIIIKCCACDILRSELKRHQREKNVTLKNNTNNLTSNHRDSTPDITEQLNWLRKELTNVDTYSHKLLVMRYQLGWTLQNISNYTGLAPGAVDGRLKRIIKSLNSKTDNNKVK